MRINYQRYIIWFITFIVVLIMLVGILLLALPSTSEWAFNKWLEDKGFTAQTKHISIDIFDSSIKINSLVVEDNAKHRFFIDELSIKFSAREIWRKKITLESINISGVSANIVGNKNAFFLLLEAGGKKQESNIKPKKSIKETIHNWLLITKNVQIENIMLCRLEFDDNNREERNSCFYAREVALKKSPYISLEFGADITGPSLKYDINAELTTLLVYDKKQDLSLFEAGSINIHKLKSTTADLSVKEILASKLSALYIKDIFSSESNLTEKPYLDAEFQA